MLQRQVTKLFRLNWTRQPAAPTAQDNRRSRSCQVVRLSPTEGLKGRQAKVNYSSHISATLYAHRTLPFGSVLRRSLVGNRKCLQACNETSRQNTLRKYSIMCTALSIRANHVLTLAFSISNKYREYRTTQCIGCCTLVMVSFLYGQFNSRL